jgi:hypothetical protein
MQHIHKKYIPPLTMRGGWGSNFSLDKLKIPLPASYVGKGGESCPSSLISRLPFVVPSPSHVSLALVCRSLACMAPVPRSPSRRRWSPPHFRCLVLVVCLAPARGVLCPRPCPCPCPCPGPGPCTPPSTLRAVARSGGGGCWVVVLAVVLVPAVPAVPAFPMPLAPSSRHHPWCSPFPPHEQLLVAVVRGAAVLADVGIIRLQGRVSGDVAG